MSVPISFSGYKKYMTCPKMYQYHYIDKDRPGQTTSALRFGSIMDEVINSILLNDQKEPYIMLHELCKQACQDDMMFYPDDLDVDLIDLVEVDKYARSKGWKGTDISKALKSFMKTQENLSKNQMQVLKKATWNSLHSKGHAMLDGFIKWVLPLIDEVHDVQKHLITKKGDII